MNFRDRWEENEQGERFVFTVEMQRRLSQAGLPIEPSALGQLPAAPARPPRESRESRDWQSGGQPSQSGDYAPPREREREREPQREREREEEIIHRLALAAGYKDKETAEHTVRMARYCRYIAEVNGGGDDCARIG